MLRDEQGRFESGAMDDELKAKISRGQMERHRRVREQQGPRPDKKRCTKCKRMLRVPEDYQMRKRVLKSGEVVRYPAGECKECSRKRSDAWRKALGEEEARRRYIRYNQRRREKDPEGHKRSQREWSRAVRERQGVVARGPWKKYRESEETVLADPSLFLEWAHWANPELTESEARYCREWRQLCAWPKGVMGVRSRDVVRYITEILATCVHPPGLHVIDAIMTRNDAADQFAAFYSDQDDTEGR